MNTPAIDAVVGRAHLSPRSTPVGHTVSCPAPYAVGGLGWHLALVVEELRQKGELSQYFCSAPKVDDQVGSAIDLWSLAAAFRWTPLRYSPAGKTHLGGALFDRVIARRLPRDDAFIGFGGAALQSFARARHLGYRLLQLEAPTSHALNVARLHHRAVSDCGIERHWLNAALVRRTCIEYQMADIISVASEYSRDSFLAAGVPANRLSRRVLVPHPRFKPAEHQTRDGVFRVVYAGSLTITKGVHLLIQAFRQLAGQAQLTLVGGWATRGMRTFLARAVHADPRVRICSGDPLPYLHRADAFVLPSYQDGLGLSALEAMACGVPVVVTEDTGMKEYVREGVNGYIVRTGDWKALHDRLEVLYHAR